MKLYSRLSLITSVTLVTGYVFVYAYTTLTLSDADSGKPLTSTLMQAVMGNITELNTRVNSLASGWGNLWGTGTSNSINYTAGNVGIGNTSPNATLDIKRMTSDSNFAAYIDGTDAANYGLWVNIANITSTKAIADFKSGNASRLFVRADGNVGIGTTNPGEKLEVAGKIFITDGGNYTIPSLKIGTTNNGISYPNSNILNFITASTSRMTIDAIGNVGIGTVAPDFGKLQVNSTAAAASTTAIPNGNIWLGSPGSTTGLSLGTTADGNVNYASYIQARDNNGANFRNLQLNPNGGNVGIGTINPEGKLDTYGAGYFGFQDYRTQAIQKVLVLRAEPISGAYSQSRFNFYTTPGTTVNGVSKLTIKSQYAVDAESTELFTLAGNGNVGIGTPSPGVKLHVLWNNEIARFETTSDGANQYAQIAILAPGGANYIWSNNNNSPWYYGGNGALNIYTGQASPIAFFTNGSYQRMTIAGNGNVMIGTTTDAGYKLDVNGSVRGTSWTPSDINLKKNIQTLSGALDKIEELRGVTYEWKDSSKWSGSQIGVIAQEVEQVFPELVNTDKQGVRAVNYAALVAPLIEAVKEQQKQISALQTEIQVLKNR